MQIILQATHGIVSGSPEFFGRAFGRDAEEYEALISRPHHFIFNRDWYEQLDGREELAQFQDLYSRLNEAERLELLEKLSGSMPSEYVDLPQSASSRNLKKILHHYVPLARTEEREIWNEVSRRKAELAEKEGEATMAEEERVEDAGLAVA